jgi:galactose mutarotase-like enzyme
MYFLSNDVLSIEIAGKGAELQSIYHLQNKLEYLWSGDAKYWAKKSPVLFPIVGGLKGNEYQYKGKTYHLGRHGFARDNEFEVSERTPESITFCLKSNDQTKLVYPFDFCFKVKYTLQAAQLTVAFIVENTGENELLFSVGAHPAFAVPVDKNLKYEDYYLLFNNIEDAGRWPLSADGLIEAISIPLLENENKLPLQKELFYKDAIVLKHLKSDSISIVNEKSSYGVRVSFDGFPYMGIWAAKDADFVCIEPWCGIADGVNSNGNFADKEGIIKLSANQIFDAAYKIELV